MTAKRMNAAEFDAGEDMGDDVDWSKATRPGQAKQRVNIDFPLPMLQQLDQEAPSEE